MYVCIILMSAVSFSASLYYCSTFLNEGEIANHSTATLSACNAVIIASVKSKCTLGYVFDAYITNSWATTHGLQQWLKEQIEWLGWVARVPLAR